MTALALTLALLGLVQSVVTGALVWRQRADILSGHAVLYPSHYA